MKLKMLALAALFAIAPLPLAAQTAEQIVTLILFAHDDNDASPVFDKNSYKVMRRSNCVYVFEFGNAGASMEFDFSKLETSGLAPSADGKRLVISYEGKGFALNRRSPDAAPQVLDRFDPGAMVGIDIPISDADRIQKAQQRFFKEICKPSPR